MAATYTVKQVADILGYSTNSIYTFLKENRIKGVRVGKGRFRIPQSEVNRLLLLPKTAAPVSTPAPATALLAEDPGAVAIHRHDPPFIVSMFNRKYTMTANIFDWFVGIAALVAGAALFLFNQTMGLASSPATIARILLIGGGLGLLLTNFFYGEHPKWHRVFHVILGISGLGMTLYFWRVGDVDAVSIYGALTFVLLLTAFTRLGTIIPFALLLALLAASAPIVVLLGVNDPHVLALSHVFNMTPLLLGVAFLFLCFGFLVLLWLGMYKKNQLFWICSYLAAGTYFLLAYIFSIHLVWSRALVFMILGMMCMYLPSWKDLTAARNGKAHTAAVSVFGIITLVLFVGIAVVYVTQMNVLSTMKRENLQKAEYARDSLIDDIQNVKAMTITASINPQLINAVATHNTEILTSLSRIMFDNGNNIRRLVYLDKNGMGLFLYPLGTFDQTDYSFRDYFIHARDVGGLYVSDIFESLIDNSHRKVVAVSAPLVDAQKQFVGVLTVSLDLDAMSTRLQKIAIGDRGEYIVVLDSHGKRIMHPMASLIGTDTEPTDPALLGLMGKSGTGEGDTYDGVLSLTSYTSLDIAPHWAVALKVPVQSVYMLSAPVNGVIAGILISFIVVAICIYHLKYTYGITHENGGGSP